MLILDDEVDLDEISCQVILEYLYNIFGELNFCLYKSECSSDIIVTIGNENDFNFLKFIELGFFDFGFFDLDLRRFVISSNLSISQKILNLKKNDNFESSVSHKCTCSIEILMREGCKCRKQSSSSHQNSTSLYILVQSKIEEITKNNLKIKYIVLGKKEFAYDFYFLEIKILKSDKESFCNFVVVL